MKPRVKVHLLPVIVFLTLLIGLFFSCRKSAEKPEAISKVDPSVPDCGQGYHWDYTLRKCVADCPSGYVYCDATGTCIPSGSSCGTPTPQYSGIELFKGLFFFDGSVGASIPYFSSMRNQLAKISSTQESQRQSFYSEIMNIVTELNPNFYNRLQKQVYSDDPDSISAVLEEGSGLLLSAVINSSYGQTYQNAVNVLNTIDTSLYDFTTMNGINTYLKDYGNKVTNTNSFQVSDRAIAIAFAAIFAVALFDVVAAVNDAAVVNVTALAFAVAAVYAKVKFWGPKKDSLELLRLERENLVGQISQYIVEGGISS